MTWSLSMLPPRPPADAADLAAQDPQRDWSIYQRPRLRWLMYRKVEEPPVVQPVTLWTAR